MFPPICNKTIEHVCREASVAAARLVRQLRLPGHERDDLSQDLLVDVFARLKSFDPARDTFGAFVGVVVVHQAARLSSRVRRRRVVFAPMSADDLLSRAGSAVTGPEETADVLRQPADRLAAVELRLDLERALSTLSRSDIALCGDLAERTPTELSREGTGARASLYRRVHEIRLHLLSVGIAPTA